MSPSAARCWCPCAFAFIACAYALSTLTDKPLVIYGVATVWAFIILSIDRALLASYRPFMSFFRKIGQFALRFVVAMLMGITIAHPMVLLLFRDTISTVIEADRAAVIETTRSQFEKSKNTVRQQVTALEATIADQRQKWNESFQAKFIIQENEDASSAIPGLTAAQQAELKKPPMRPPSPSPIDSPPSKLNRRNSPRNTPSCKPSSAFGKRSSNAS